MANKWKLIIKVEGGVVRSVRGPVPQDCDVEVRDYDIEGRDDSESPKDSRGVRYDLQRPPVRRKW